MRILVTGSSGFYGAYVCEELESSGYEVVRCDISASNDNTVPLDIMNLEGITNILNVYNPDIIINMAGQANVGKSWEKPQLTVQINTIGFINILEAVRSTNRRTRIVAIGSSDEYGVLKESGKNVTEKMPLNPVTPYAISKQAQELFAQLYIKAYDMDICLVRQFNIGGPGQAKGFMIADFASGIAEIEAGKKDCLLVGNLESARDYTHVKDAARAIRMIAENGQKGEVYNIASGVTYTAQEVLDMLIQRAKVNVNIVRDKSRLRPSDTPVICGNHEKLTLHTSWEPSLSITDIVSDTLDYWRNQMGN